MKRFAYILLIGIAIQTNLSAQIQEPEDVALESSEFRNSFYESLKQKGIENYDKAVTALLKCQKLEPNNPVVYFELGKNYLAQKDYKKAYESFEQVTKMDPSNKWAWVGMYDVCYETKDYNQAIVIVKKLVEFKSEYKEDLTSLYMNTQQFDKALELINELNETVGTNDLRDSYKAAIMKNPKYQGSEISNLLDKIKLNPKDESNYVSLMFLYWDSDQDSKALDIAQKLEKEVPGSDWAQISLFKYHLTKGDGPKAVKAMNQILASKKIDNKIRHRVMNEFLLFAKDKPEYEADLQKAISYFDNDKEVKVAKEIGKFYHAKKNWAQAVRYYEQHLKSEPNDMEAIFLVLEAYAQQPDYVSLGQRAEGMIESYPLQPQFYYYAGLAYNQQKNFKKAKDLLEIGLDYVVDDKQLETSFYIQLGEAWNGLGDQKKKESYFLKAEKLLDKKK
ncbi:tetratricopeptide repeat protein [Flavobacterium sp. MAH-1]|uniref:Tetratricopeptide repeat protein n=1 Tax=Flavobacterium agri TaxID=2743471 RepID=A0A7Y9C4T2_9FLAO|nr:tetratricopeptide repeat protein [Flavobacterium agri]NUY80175.1 tetratricopeptide repeat protein [Flavobacterium agri]NYA70200.1 tetratricopeptide repeat protein [Flavobacterium agri]